jgi:serine phosphatase RsbU (regulator of sigma subunit)
LLDLAWAASIAYPSVAPWGGVIHFGPVGIGGNNLGYILFCLGIAAVVLRRFIRVARDEQRAAAELEAARTVQQILVPEEIPTIPGFFVEAVYHPAGQVGGDFYQVLPTPNGGLLAIIGDVSGKGMPAAMTVSLLVGTVHTLAHYTQEPAEILTAMNQRMLGRGSGFTTCLALRLDPDGTLTAANAGHLSPYANGKEIEIDNGLPLGITAAAAYSNTTRHLESGTTLTLLTDGVVEAQNAKGELFGFERAAAISSKPAQAVAEAAQAFGQEDDITVLSLALVAVS